MKMTSISRLFAASDTIRALAFAAVVSGLLATASSTVKADEPALQEPAPAKVMGLELVFDDDFEKPALDTWKPTDSAAWRYDRDQGRGVCSLFQPSKYRAKHRSPYGIAWREGVFVSDFVMDVWMRSKTKDYGHRDVCLFFGGQDADHFYYAHLGLKADDHSHHIMIVNDAPRTGIAKSRTDGTPWEERYHHGRIVRTTADGMIRIYFDDMAKPIMTAQDTTFDWGKVGIGSFDDSANFDRVTLWGKRVERPKATTTTKPVK